MVGCCIVKDLTTPIPSRARDVSADETMRASGEAFDVDGLMYDHAAPDLAIATLSGFAGDVALVVSGIRRRTKASTTAHRHPRQRAIQQVEAQA